jgi:transposase
VYVLTLTVVEKEPDMSQTTRREDFTSKTAALHLSFDLGWKEWKLAFAAELGQKARLRTIAAADLAAVDQEISRAKVRFGLAESAPVVSCYEAGRDGFWLHRWLWAQGVENYVVDSSSLEVNRRARRAKTDRLDAQKLVAQLLRFTHGEQVWSVVRVPTLEQEDRRQLPRELEHLKHERTSHCNRIKGLLASQGVRLEVRRRDFLERLEKAVLWDGQALPAGLKQRLLREHERFEGVERQIRDLEQQRQRQLEESPEDPTLAKMRQLMALKAIGANSANVFVSEFFGWREFRNRREIGALSGLAPMPYQSGDSLNRSSGISGGNGRLRAMAIEIAWAWLRFQPRSRLSLWFQERYGAGSRRSRRVGIVAMARRLLIELWRYLKTGALPDGAELKAT